jgi:hypothetical protein
VASAFILLLPTTKYNSASAAAQKTSDIDKNKNNIDR